MSEAIWLAGSSLPRASRESPNAWLERFLAESRVKPEWITTAHVIQPKHIKNAPAWNLPVLPFFWIGGAAQTHFVLGALCRELRAGEQELVLILEKDPAGWHATLLATPAFFGARNRIPAVLIQPTTAFPQADPANLNEFFTNNNLPALPALAERSQAAWVKNGSWVEAVGLVRVLNAASTVLASQSGGRSALISRAPCEPILITTLEGL